MKEFAIINQSTATVYSSTEKTRIDPKTGYVLSNIADKGLYGNLCRVIGEKDGMIKIMSHYGYIGFISPENLIFLSREEKDTWLGSNLMVVTARCLDVMTAPKVQGNIIASLPGGALVGTYENEPVNDGWLRVKLPDGTDGYVTAVHLGPKLYGEDYLDADPDVMEEMQLHAIERRMNAAGGKPGFSLQKVLDEHFDGSEERFREALVRTARSYLGVQYRWGGRSTFGIDCSGLVSMSYLLNGISIYRDASIVTGHVLKRLEMDWDENGHFLLNNLDKMLPGDALYFPGHVAMYLGDGKYIHSTGKAGANGVVINSLIPGAKDFRRDLLECFYAVGGVRLE